MSIVKLLIMDVCLAIVVVTFEEVMRERGWRDAFRRDRKRRRAQRKGAP